MATYRPPTQVRSAVPVDADRNSLAYMCFRHSRGGLLGRTVLKVNGTYAVYDQPSQDTIDSATEVYLGGHVYDVSTATGNALVAAVGGTLT